MRSKSAAQAEKILTAAAQLFATHRFHEARMDDIATLAEVGKGTLYRYFKDKEELYVALLQGASEGLQQRLQACRDATADPVEQLRAVVEAIIHYFDERPHLFDLIQHAEVMHKSEQDFPWLTTRRQILALVKELLQESDYVIEDLELAALMLLGGLRGVLRFGQRPRPVQLAEKIVQGFLNGYATKYSSGRGRTLAYCEASVQG